MTTPSRTRDGFFSGKRDLFRKARRGAGRSRSSELRRGRPPRAALVELLETRRLLSAIVTTDKQAYAPTDTVHITGSGFAAGETVDLQVVNETTGVSYAPWTATDDASGDFASTWTAPSDSPGDMFQV